MYFKPSKKKKGGKYSIFHKVLPFYLNWHQSQSFFFSLNSVNSNNTVISKFCAHRRKQTMCKLHGWLSRYRFKFIGKPPYESLGNSCSTMHK